MKKNYLKHFTLCLTIVLLTTIKSYAQAGASLHFDGIDDQVNMGTSIATTLDALNNITVEAWVRTTGYPNPFGNYLGTIVGNYGTSGGGMQFLLRRDNETFVFYVNCGAGFQNVSSPALINVWQHVAAVWDGSTLKIYLNGVLQNTTTGVTGPSFVSVINPVKIGKNTGDENLTGNLDEVRIWTKARSQCEIQAYMNCEIPSNANGLLANYHFNQGVGNGSNPSETTLMDATSSALNGNLSGFGLNGATTNWVTSGGVTSGSITPGPTSTSPLTVNSGSICSGNEFEITPNVTLSSYTVTGGSLIVSPTSNTNYTVMAKNDANGCALSPSVAVSNVTVVSLPLPTGVTLTGDKSVICTGEVLTFTATGALNYRWSMGGFGSVYAFRPSVPGAAVVYSVRGYDANGCYGTASASVSVNICTTIEELNSSNLLSIYPNPSSGQFNLDVTTENTIVSIFDALGNMVYTEKLNSGKQQIDISNQASGLYFIQAKNNDKTYSTRLIKE